MGGATRFLMLLATPFPPRTSFLRLAHHHHYRRCLSSLSSLSVSRGVTGSSHRLGSCRVKSSSSRQLHAQASTFRDDQFSDSASPALPGAPHPWPEWRDLLGSLSASGYLREGSGRRPPQIGCEDDYATAIDLPEEFFRAASACLAFARDRPNLLGELPRSDVEIVVNSGSPFLFKNVDDSIKRLKSFLNGGEGTVMDVNVAQTVDIMRFILSYASNPVTQEPGNSCDQELVIQSVRNLMRELAKLSSAAYSSNYTVPIEHQFPGRYGQPQRPWGKNIEMKRGDWICPRCNFMNFARNMKCLECEEARPKRQLTGGEWECPQCDFINNGRNTACLRCDCNHPGGFSSSGSGYSSGNYGDRAELERRLAANEEKAQRWFSKVSQLDSTSDLNSAIADEDFPEIMPLRKGVNRFVVSTRKTPLERRLANAQYRRNSSSDGTFTDGSSQVGDINKTADPLMSRRLDDSTTPHSNSPSTQQGYPRGNTSSYVPFVPLPADMFAKKPKIPATGSGKATEERSDSLSLNPREQTSTAVDSFGTLSGDTEREQEEKSERWFKRVSESQDSRDMTSTIPDEDFPEIMPMRKGENRFVVSKNNDRSPTSPTYKRRASMEQASNSSSNYVPFVPFPPDYFAKKETRNPGLGDSTDKASGENSFSSVKTQEQMTGNPEVSSGNWNVETSVGNATTVRSSENATQKFGSAETSSNAGTTKERVSMTSSSTQQPKSYSMSGKSLEGSAVKETDPLDMSEEAKAERWFRRVAQIKDISELSQIPDEDFPSIMPMRKGVNRFVVSKRKTPLERRLTNSQYRRNLPVVSSDPIKKDDDRN